MRVLDGLAGLRPGVEHNAVAGLSDAGDFRDPVRLSCDLGQEAVTGLGNCSQIGVMISGDDQHMHWCLRINVTERDRAGTLQHPVRGNFSGRDAAEQAICHVVDTNLCWPA